ncbi:hypothetical protein B0T19DRAFT_413492 [Cercophora scortea]|uniref:Uncharacterized protein n=1 Tax=Cercophora scortea TaxID=314031 RepID=A0AAE0MN43_9PEZI|nr:hypothetical protein B0T19DRAFT_413492 [Cercophora scortea]
MDAAAPPSLAPAVLRYRRTPAIVAALYLAVLTTPWILTCVFGRLKPVDPLESISAKAANDDGRWTIAVAVLNALAMLFSLPAIYALLARAVVVNSQRRRDDQTLNARQLFGLADGRFLAGTFNDHQGSGDRSSVAFWGGMLVIIAIVLPPIRSAFVNQNIAFLGYAPETLVYPPGTHDTYKDKINDRHPKPWVSFKIGTDATLSQITRGNNNNAVVLAKTRLAFASSHPAEWLPLAPRDPETGLIYASALSANTSTGMYRQLGLRLDTTASCVRRPNLDAHTGCESTWNGTYTMNYANNGLKVSVCMDTSTYWKDAEYAQEDRNALLQQLKEIALIDVMPTDPDDGTILTDEMFTIECRANTSLGHFELGNTLNGGRAGPLLRTVPTTRELRAAGFVYKSDTQRTTPEKPDFTGLSDVSDYNWTPDHSSGSSGGPLWLMMQALFGAGSYFSIAQFPSDDTTNDQYVDHAICQAASVLPFSRLYSEWNLNNFACAPSHFTADYRTTASAAAATNRLLRYHLLPKLVTNGTNKSEILPISMYLANRALLETTAMFGGPGVSGTTVLPVEVWNAPALEVHGVYVPLWAMIIISTLVGLQVLGILVLLRYIYTVPTWTATLDAMAIARVAYQLQDGGAIGRIWMEDVDVEKLEKVDGLVGVVEPAGDLEERRRAARGVPPDVSVWRRPDEPAATNANNRTSNISTSPSTRVGEVDGGFEQMELELVDTYRSDVLPPPRVSESFEQLGDQRHAVDDNASETPAPAADDGRVSPPAYTARRETEPPAYSSGLTKDDYKLQVGATGLIKRSLVRERKPVVQD